MTLKEKRRRVSSILLSVIFWAGFLTVVDLHAQSPAGVPQVSPLAPQQPVDTELQRAARQGDLTALRSRLQQGADPNVRDALGRTPLLEAVRAGQTEAVRLLLGAGAKVNVPSLDGRTPLIEAAAQGQTDAAKLLIEGGADLNTIQRGSGTALQTAERSGHNDIAALLRQAGARSSGRSIGDTVCVRPWKGDGYCGTVESVNKTVFTIRVTKIVGCDKGCPARAECSAGRDVGGVDGLHPGEAVTTRSWCLTHTGVQP